MAFITFCVGSARHGDNLVNPENSDAWNCLMEIDGQETMAQVFSDVIIQNTGSAKGDHF